MSKRVRDWPKGIREREKYHNAENAHQNFNRKGDKLKKKLLFLFTRRSHVDGIIGEISDEILEGVESLLHDAVHAAETLFKVGRLHVGSRHSFKNKRTECS